MAANGQLLDALAECEVVRVWGFGYGFARRDLSIRLWSLEKEQMSTSDDAIKDVLKLFRYGFYALTSCDGDDLNAMVFNWFSQVSFEPRLVAVGLQKTAYSYGLVKKSGVFAVNLFSHEDRDALMPFTKGRAKNPDKMAAAKYSKAPETGAPILDGASAYIEFEVQDVIDIGGDHDIVVGRPVGAAILKEAAVEDVLTLTDLGWSYAG
jgi:flavin reductase (DIM6/NTAB) family NADH-FMN oxidoreductase RutF